jgi:antitoxin MazE
MIAKVRKWGNSLGLRIPKPLAEEARLDGSSEVDMAWQRGRLVIRPLERRGPTLRDLLRRVTARNLHREVDASGPRGREAW